MVAQEIRTMKAAVGIGQQSEWISLNAMRRCDEAAEFEQALRSRVVAQDNAIAALSELCQLYLAKLKQCLSLSPFRRLKLRHGCERVHFRSVSNCVQQTVESAEGFASSLAEEPSADCRVCCTVLTPQPSSHPLIRTERSIVWKA